MSKINEGPNQPRKGVRRRTISVDLLPSQHTLLKRLAQDKRISMSRFLVELFEEDLNHARNS
jgi:hypothetical protein